MLTKHRDTTGGSDVEVPPFKQYFASTPAMGR